MSPGSALTAGSARRTGSIRRFLSKRSLNKAYAAGDDAQPGAGAEPDIAASDRPESPSSTVSGRTGASDKGGRWYRRFSRDLGERKPSRDLQNSEADVAPKGPPPPTLPELKLDVVREEGEELFRSIR